MKKFLGLVALATLLFASCQKEEGVKVDQKLKSVTLELANVIPGTKTLETPVNTGDKAVLNNLTIFFLNGTDNLIKGSTEVAGTEATTYYTLGESGTWSEGTVFHYLPATVTKVIVVGNMDDQSAVTSYSTLKAMTTNVSAQQGVSSLYLYGEADLNTKTGEDLKGHPLYKATVNLKPVVSRIEITGFEYAQVNTETALEYKSVSVDQVVFDNFYSTTTINVNELGGTNAATVNGDLQYTEIKAENVFDFFKAANGKGWYSDTYTTLPDTYGMLLNADNSYKQTPLTTGPSYNFFPHQNKIPQLVVKLTGTKADKNQEAQYLVTSKIVKQNGTAEDDNAITTDVNNVYKMYFKFTDADFNDPVKCVEVYVDVTPWNPIIVTPIF